MPSWTYAIFTRPIKLYAKIFCYNDLIRRLIGPIVGNIHNILEEN
jgi:hypothetical protein